MKKTPISLSKVMHKLPVIYQDLSTEEFVYDLAKINRIASFKHYDSGESTCYFFYKPISKLIDDQEENI